MGGISAWQLKEEVTRYRGRLAVADDTKPALAGNGAGVVFGPAGTDWILVRIDGVDPPVLARNFSGHVFADNEQITVKRMSTGPEPAFWKVIHRQHGRPNFYARYTYSTTPSSPATPAEEFYLFRDGSVTLIGVPPYTKSFGGFVADGWSWLNRSGVMLPNGDLYAIPRYSLFSDSNPPPPSLDPSPFQTPYSNRRQIIQARFSTSIMQWSEKSLRFPLNDGSYVDFSSNIVDTHMTNFVIDTLGNIWMLYFQGSSTSSGGFCVLMKVDPNYVVTSPWGNSPTTYFRRLPDIFSSPAMYSDWWSVLMHLNRSFDEFSNPNIVVGAWGTADGIAGLSDLFDITPPTGWLTGTQPSSLTANFRRLGSGNPMTPFRPVEAFWRDKLTNDLYIWQRDALWRCGNLYNPRAAENWATVYSYAFAGISDTFSYTHKCPSPLDGSVVFAWYGFATVGGLEDLRYPPERAIPARAGQTTGGNPDGALRYDGPPTIGSTDRRWTLWRFSTTGMTAIWTIVAPLGTNGGPVRMVTSGRKIYVSVGSQNALPDGTFTFFDNPYITAGIYEVDPVSGAVSQLIGAPTGYPGGWSMLVSEFSHTGLLY